MNRRYFMGILTASLGLALSNRSYSSSSYPEILGEFITPYTYQVGKSIISSQDVLTDQYNLEAKINNWLLIDDKLHISKINELINNDLYSSQFYEIDGWVITETEALISAIIVGAA